jgi:hypothetical protein
MVWPQVISRRKLVTSSIALPFIAEEVRAPSLITTGAGTTKQVTPVTFNPADKGSHIALSNSNFTASLSSGGWATVRATGPYKSTGKAYFRCRIEAADFMAAGFATPLVQLSGLIGGDDVLTGDGVSSFTAGSGGSLGTWYHNARATGGPDGINVGDWVIVAIDMDVGSYWTTYQTSAGSLNTNWNNGANSPAAGTGALSVADLAGQPLIAGSSLNKLSGGPQCTIDCQTIISDPTLVGFAPWARLQGTNIPRWAPQLTPNDFTLSNGKKTATVSPAADWRSVICMLPPQASKVYWRVKYVTQGRNYVLAGLAGQGQNLGSYVGVDAHGIGGYGLPGEGHCDVQIGRSTTSPAFPGLANDGDYIVVASDKGAVRVWFTTMTAGGALNTNWNNTGNPAMGTGGFDVSSITNVIGPAASLLHANQTATLDGTTVLSDATLAGFVPYSSG